MTAGIKPLAFLLCTSPLAAHMVSMSTGEVRVDGARARYELKMPLYELKHIPNSEAALFDHIRFSSGGAAGRLTGKTCRAEDVTYLCTAVYEFPAPVDTLGVECTFPAITVANHVHVLRAYNHGKTDEAVFDLSYTTATLRFHPPSVWEVAIRGTAGGFMRAVGGVAPLLFLISLALAARKPRELVWLTAAFVVGQTVACLVMPRIPWALSPRFIEAAAALSVAYLAFEIVLLPDAGNRWMVAGVLGLFQGAYFSLFLTESEYGAVPFLAGVFLTEAALLSILGLLRWRLFRFIRLPRAVPVAASALLVVGLCWFFLRLRS